MGDMGGMGIWMEEHVLKWGRGRFRNRRGGTAPSCNYVLAMSLYTQNVGLGIC